MQLHTGARGERRRRAWRPAESDEDRRMNAVRYHEHGSADVLRYEPVEEPVAGESEVVISMRACGVNHFDVDLRAGVSRWPLPLPHQLGVEFAGVVDEVGPGVDTLAVGDRVWARHEIECGHCRYCAAGRPNLCRNAQMFSVQLLGGYAERVLAPARAIQRCRPISASSRLPPARWPSPPPGTCWSAAVGCSRARRSWSRPRAAGSGMRPCRSPPWPALG